MIPLESRSELRAEHFARIDPIGQLILILIDIIIIMIRYLIDRDKDSVLEK